MDLPADKQLRQDIAALHAEIYNALSNPTRLLIVCLLSDEARNVSQLTDELSIPQPSVSRHLKVLVDKNLIQAKRDGQFVVYQLSDERVISALRIVREMVVDRLQGNSKLADSMRESDPLLLAK